MIRPSGDWWIDEISDGTGNHRNRLLSDRLVLARRDERNQRSGIANSAVEWPKPSVFGEIAYPDIFEKATALFESIAKNPCFQNANKRTAFVALVQFLSYNGLQLVIDQQEAEDFVVDTVTHQHNFHEIADMIRKHAKEK